MKKERLVKRRSKSQPTLEGAGVHLKRAFGNRDPKELDPFLLLDDFHSDNPSDYMPGFPWHPHRGIETITYVLHGKIDHGDSLGNKGIINPDIPIQWMTAGNGIVHQEMPGNTIEDGTLMWGFQLWANLPRSHKMREPRYQEIKATQIPEINTDSGAKVKVICGEVNGIKGPVQDITIEPQYLDITIKANSSFKHEIKEGHTCFAYTLQGEALFDQIHNEVIGKETLVIYQDGDHVYITTKDKPTRFLLVSGKPLNEPIAWGGPIVMNTQEELETAFREYRNGTFLKHILKDSELHY